MSDIFLDNFERTEFSDYLHGILGRSLIIATRFDSMCKNLATHLKIKTELYENPCLSGPQFEELISKVINQSKTLYQNIEYLDQDKLAEIVLKEARLARNEIAHSLAVGLDGCIRTISQKEFILEITELIKKIVTGDIVISQTLALLNNEPTMNNQYLSSYEKRVLDWVIEE